MSFYAPLVAQKGRMAAAKIGSGGGRNEVKADIVGMTAFAYKRTIGLSLLEV